MVDTLTSIIEEDISKIFKEPVHIKHLPTLLCLDFLIVQLLLGPAHCLIWISIWNIMDIILGHHFLTGVFCFSIGIFLSIIMVAISDSLLSLSQYLYRSSKCLFFLFTRLYSFLSCMVLILFWKGWYDIRRHEDENRFLKHHWWFSLPYLLFGSLVLGSLGCLKTAAVRPPLGVWLDKGEDYLKINKFYTTQEDKMKNAMMTVLVEVISLLTYYGAWCLVDDLVVHQTIIVTNLSHVFQLLLAIILSALAYLCSILYLHHHHHNQPTTPTSHHCQDIFYAVLLILVTIATAAHLHAWWGLVDLLTESCFTRHDLTPFLLILGISGAILLLTGVTTTNHLGIQWEIHRDKEGILIPFFYFVFLLREKDFNH